MRFSCLQENLKDGLNSVSHIAGKNVNLPILNNVMIEAVNGNINLIATDLEIGIINRVRGKIEEEGVFTVDSKIISDYVALLPNKKVDIEQIESKVTVRCDNYQTKIKGQTAEEYPLIPQIDRNNFFKIKISEFKKALTQVIFATASSEIRLELTGVLFSFDGNNLFLAATDSYRLAEKKITIDNKLENKNEKIIVPAKTVQELVRILSSVKEMSLDDGSDGMSVYVTENQIMFEVGTIELVSRLIEGQFPDYKQIIPVNTKTNVVVGKKELSRAVKISSLFSKSGVNDINLDFPKNKNKSVISSISGQTGESVTEIESVVNGEDNGVVVNYKYLLDCLNNVDSEYVKIDIIDGNTPCVIRPEKDDSYFYIIMPIKQ